MRIKTLLNIVSAFGLALLSVGNAYAQKEGLYFGGSAGLYDIKENSLDEQDDFWKIFLGGQINEWFGLEASYLDFSRASKQGSSFDADGVTGAAVVSFPIGEKSAVFGKIGELWWDAESNFAGVRANTDGNDAFWGAGLKFGFTKSIALRIEYERYDIADIDLDTASAGLQITF